jgi:hypothetical protein
MGITIITNSLRMFFNYRSQLYEDLSKKQNIQFLLSEPADIKMDVQSVELGLQSRSSSKTSLLRDIYLCFCARGYLKDQTVIVFTVRNLIIYGIVSMIIRQKFKCGYFAGLGELFTHRRRNSFFFNWFVKHILARYEILVVLNSRDFNYVSSLATNKTKVLSIMGEGYSFSFPDYKNNNEMYDYGIVGRLNLAKGGLLLKQIADRSPTRSFVVWGTIDEELACIHYPSNVHFKSFEPDKKKIFSSFKSLLYISTLNEGLPFIFLEAIDYQKQILAIGNETTDEFLSVFGIQSYSEEQLCSMVQRGVSFELRYEASDLLQLSYDECNGKLVQLL